MECRDVRELAESFVSDQRPVESTRGVVAHLEGCPACRAGIADLRRLRQATRAAFEGAPELAARPDFAASITSRLRADARLRGPAGTPRRVWLRTAAGILLAAGAGWGWREWSTSGLVELLASAVGDHRFCALTFKLTEQPISLQEAARRYGGVHRLLETFDLSATLSGGPMRIVERHSCVFDGQRFAHLVLRYKNETVSLLVADAPPARNRITAAAIDDARPSLLPVTDGFRVASFRGARQVVFVVSSLSAGDVQEVAGALVAPVSQVLAGA